MTKTLAVRLSESTSSGAVAYLSERVEEGSLILTASESVDSGEWVRFEVRLSDESAFLEGVGRCGGCAESEVPNSFDVLLEQLTLEGSNEIMFERIMMAYQSAEEEEAAAAAAGAPESNPEPVVKPIAKPVAMPPQPSVPLKAAAAQTEPEEGRMSGVSYRPAGAEPRPETIAPPPMPPRENGGELAETLPGSEGAPPTVVFSDELEARVDALVPHLRRARLAKKRSDAVDLIFRVGLAALEAQSEST